MPIPKPSRRHKPPRRRGVSPELHALVLARDDYRCFVLRVEPDHVCSGRLTLDHVNDGPILARRAPDDAQHLVAMCEEKNVAGPSRVVRQAERAYLARLYDIV